MSRLIDNHGRPHTYLRISVTDRCNLRCFYCMPHEGIEWKSRNEILSFDEIATITRVMVELGIKKVRLTGGEPLARKDLVGLISMLGAIQGLETLAMTTNAVLLAPKAQAIKDAGITDLNISIDSLKKDRFARITGRDCLDSVLSGIEAALAAGFPRVKLNTVIMAGVNDDEICDFIDFVKDKDLNIRFIEFMPFKNNDWNIEKVFTYKQMREKIESMVDLERIIQDPSDVAKDFSIVGSKGTVSFITSMSESFCSTCTRLRLTADGSLKTCLFFPPETSLRDFLRSASHNISERSSMKKLEELILSTIKLKPAAHPPAHEISTESNHSMIEIGG